MDRSGSTANSFVEYHDGTASVPERNRTGPEGEGSNQNTAPHRRMQQQPPPIYQIQHSMPQSTAYTRMLLLDKRAMTAATVLLSNQHKQPGRYLALCLRRTLKYFDSRAAMLNIYRVIEATHAHAWNQIQKEPYITSKITLSEPSRTAPR